MGGPPSPPKFPSPPLLLHWRHWPEAQSWLVILLLLIISALPCSMTVRSPPCLALVASAQETRKRPILSECVHKQKKHTKCSQDTPILLTLPLNMGHIRIAVHLGTSPIASIVEVPWRCYNSRSQLCKEDLAIFLRTLRNAKTFYTNS